MVEFIITDIDALVIVLIRIISFVSGLFPRSFVRPAATTFAHKLHTNSLVRHVSHITGYRHDGIKHVPLMMSGVLLCHANFTGI